MINLLPPHYKEELRRTGTLRSLLLFEIVLGLSLVCVLLILFAFQLFLQMRASSLEQEFEQERVVLEQLDRENVQGKAVALNKNARLILSFYEDQIPLSRSLRTLEETLPPQMYVTNMTWQERTSQISLAGYAQDREVLFAFRQNLEREPSFSEVFFPPSNWVEPSDIEFQVSFTVEP